MTSRDIICKTKKSMESPGMTGGSSLTVLTMISSSSNGGAGGPGGNGQQNGGSMGMGINGGSPDSTTQQTTSNSASSSPAGSGISLGGSSSSASTSLANGTLGGSGSSNSSGGIGVGGGGGRSSTTGTTTTPPNMYSLKWNTQLLALQRSLANLWDSGIGTDAVLLCQGTPLPVHKIILTAASPYVASVVHTMATAQHMMPVVVVDISAEAGKALLSFLYCGEAHVPVSIIPQLVAGAKFLGISGFGEPGVLESLTGMIPERDRSSMTAPSPSPSQTSSVLDKSSSSLRSTNSPFTSKSESSYGDPLHIPQMQLPLIPPIQGVHVSHVPSPSYLSSQLQSVQSSNNNNNSRKSSERTKNNSPYPPHFMESLNSSGGKIGQGNRHQLPAYVTKKSPKNRIFMGGTSILDNLLKNPKGSNSLHSHSHSHSHSNTHLGSNYDGPVNLSCGSGNCNEANDNNEHQKYEAEGYADNATVNSQPHGFYYSPAHGGGGGIHAHGHYMEDTQLMDQMGDNDNDVDNGPIPAQLLEPNVEYHIGKEFTAPERYSGLTVTPQNPLLDLAKVASSMQSQLHHGERGVKRKQQQQIKGLTVSGIHDRGGNGVEIISSTGRHSILDASPPQLPPVKIKIKKTPEAIICEICGKKFSNAYNLRVHMEGHSGQVFVCSVCSHASRSRDALRKHFAYRHRELWISGMSAFRKNVPGRKLSISKSNNNSTIKMELPDSEPNNNIISNSNNINDSSNTLLDSKGNFNLNIRGSDGTLTISEAFPDNSHKHQK